MSVFKPKTNREVFIILLKQIPKQLKWKILECYSTIMYRCFGKLIIYTNPTNSSINIMANDLVEVQPMQEPKGILYYLEYTYNEIKEDSMA